MKLLDARQIKQKIERLAIEILEHNFDEKELIFAGINNTGTLVAERLKTEIQRISPDVSIKMATISLSPANPLEKEVGFDMKVSDLEGKVVIVIDDVVNTGRTLHYAMKPFFSTLPKKIEVAVLVDRKHKSFPIVADYVGLSLATTLKENIHVDIRGAKEEAVYLN